MSERRGNVRGATALIIALLFLVGTVGCEADAPTGPTTADLARERKALASNARKKKPVRKPVAQVAQGVSEEPSFGVIDRGSSYDFDGKRDPFRSFQWEQLALEQQMAESHGPLEQFDVGQLSLIAVVWKTGSAKALVQDPSGQSYIVGPGTKIGKNQGVVVDIDDNLLLVKETYVDFLGQETTKDIEMRIRRSHGG